MKSQLKVTFLLSMVLVVSVVAAQQSTPPPASPGDKVQLPKSQLPDLHRQTKEGDKVPPFEFDYFVGKWNFTWDVPETMLGPAGSMTGTTVFTKVEGTDGKYYQAVSEGTGPSGPIKMTETIGYLKDHNTLSRFITDGRGYSFLQIGTIGGDLGGYFNIYYDGAPVTINGKSVRFKHAMRLLSPVNFKVATTVSIDGGPFMNYGNPWWRKDVPGVTAPRP